MTFTAAELKAIESRTPEELARINAQWAAMSEEEKSKTLDWYAQREMESDMIKGVALVAAILFLIVVPAIGVAVKLLGG